jgi:hypothetical protein
MRVYVLRFENMGRLTRAFDLVLEDAQVESSMIEPEHLRLRFVGPRALTDRLVEKIYQDGGLTWCGRHDLVDEEGASVEPLIRAELPRSR